MGIPQGYPDYVLHKMVTVMRGGEEVKISKRAGSYVTLRDLIDEVGRDAVRFFLVSRKADTEFVFDIDLAAVAVRGEPGLLRAVRACARLRRAAAGRHRAGRRAARARATPTSSPLTSPYEEALLRRLADFPAELARAARELAPHQVTFYLKDLAQRIPQLL